MKEQKWKSNHYWQIHYGNGHALLKGRESIQFDENVGALLQPHGDTAILSLEYMDLQTETYVRAK
ncbi:MAG: hypothetical protein IPJ22_11205 [Bacteroidetes bacterium]|nr:hypothetical protein [Bacteroidota bacterium]